MCTVTYLPQNENGFILTHNRDEHHTRSIAKLPTKKLLHGIEILAPIDEQGGGTWFASSKMFTLCLLNGGYEKHISQPPYKHSRGLIIFDFFNFNSVELFREHYDFSGIEPFTLIIIDHTSQKVNQLVSDSTHVYHSIKHSKEKHIWSSSTLYSANDKERRLRMFANWQHEHSSFEQKDIIAFHESTTNEENEGILINRESILKTVSLTSFQKMADNSFQFIYKDFIQQKDIQLEF